jgi:hypothetical protein
MEPTHPVLYHNLLVIQHRCLVQTRELALAGNKQQIFDLADTMEIFPDMMAQWEDDDLDRVGDVLADYQTKYPGTAYDYLAILNMDEAEFRAVYQLPKEASAQPIQKD